MAMIDPRLCPVCKGARNLCGLGRCPWLESIKGRFNVAPRVRGKHIFGPSPPNIFVGRAGYPKVNIGPVVSVDETLDDRTSSWYGRPIEDIIVHRAQMYRGMNAVDVRPGRRRDRIYEANREVALSAREVDVEIEFTRDIPPLTVPELDHFVQPMGPSVEAKRVDVVGNAVVPRKVDRLVSDTDVDAATALYELMGSTDIEYMQRLLSAGLLGTRRRRRIVPTRWAITAVDDTLGRALIGRVVEYQQLSGDVEVYHSKYIGNDIWVILKPDIWSFEMLEAWCQGSFWSTETTVLRDGEGHDGRKGYARNITGAYYAARLAVLEHLDSRRRQASAIVYREITDEYFAPLGVWVIRETARHAMGERPMRFQSMREAVNYISQNVNVKSWHEKSLSLKSGGRQSTLEEFLAGQ